MRIAVLTLAACTPSRPDLFTVVDGTRGAYALTQAPIPELDDPYLMRGSLGDGHAGGYLDQLEDGSFRYAGGGRLAVDYAVVDGVGVPLDADGIAIWTYYHTLSTTRTQLDGLGIDVDVLFPVDFAFQPSAGGLGLVTSNAAYVSGGAHVFALLADPVGADLPLAANPVVVRHELGHALFQTIVLGEPRAYDAVLSGDTALKALNEGFADIVASMLLDDPDILGASFPVSVASERRLDGDASTDTAAPVEDTPYGRGTVYASYAWDLRLATDDPDLVFQAAVEGLARWTQENGWPTVPAQVDHWALHTFDALVVRYPASRDAACVALERRFPGLDRTLRCSLL